MTVTVPVAMVASIVLVAIDPAITAAARVVPVTIVAVAIVVGVIVIIDLTPGKPEEQPTQKSVSIVIVIVGLSR